MKDRVPDNTTKCRRKRFVAEGLLQENLCKRSRPIKHIST